MLPGGVPFEPPPRDVQAVQAAEEHRLLQTLHEAGDSYVTVQRRLPEGAFRQPRGAMSNTFATYSKV